MITTLPDRRAVFACSLGIWLVAVSYAIITPPFQVPDEVAHYWHSVALAHGNVLQETHNGRMGSYVPKSARDFVYLTWVDTAGHPEKKVGLTRLREASKLPYQPEPVFRGFPALYAPIPYLPATLSCLITDLLHVRPLIAFYLGRVVTATAAVMLIAAAMLECGELGLIIAAIASLPMALFLFGSWSADALTIAIALYTASVAWRVRSDADARTSAWVRLCVAAGVLATCKSVYAPIALLAIAPHQKKRARIVLLFASIILGLACSAVVLSRQYYPLRADTDPKAQIGAIKAHPLRVMSVVVQDYAERWADYRDQFVGRLGWADVPLPGVLIAMVFYLLIAVAATSSVSITPGARLFAAVLGILMCIGVSLSQYIVWTPAGATQIEGIQGRYFLPVALVLLLPFAAIVKNRRLTFVILVLEALSALAINAEALVLLVKRYY
jgi:uncharacterized membrane protein